MYPSKSQLARLAISTSLSIFSFTLVFPTVTASLITRGFNGRAVGLMASMVYLSVLVSGLVMPVLLQRLKPATAYNLGKTMLAVGFLVFTISDHYMVWIAANLLLGFGTSCIWPLTEGAIVSSAPDGEKGSLAGLFQTIFGLAFAGGPFVASLLTLEKNKIFIIASMVSAVSWIAAFGFPWPKNAQAPTKPKAREKILRKMVTTGLMTAAFIGGLFENGMDSIIIALGVHLGMPTSRAIALAGVIGTGSVVGPYPTGKLADRIGAHRVLPLSLILLSISMAALALVPYWQPLIWFLTLCWGILGAGLYTLALATSGAHFQGHRIMKATSIIVSLYTLGAFIGPCLGGIAFDYSKSYGLIFLFLPMALLGLISRIVVSNSP